MTASVSPLKRPSVPSPEQLLAFRAQLVEQHGFRVDQLRMLCLTPIRSSRSAREVTIALKSGARSALREVDAALARMDEGTYGHCISCGEQLELDRLEVLPQVARCMPCQRAAELA